METGYQCIILNIILYDIHVYVSISLLINQNVTIHYLKELLKY